MKKLWLNLWVAILAVLLFMASIPKAYWRKITQPGLLRREYTTAAMAKTISNIIVGPANVYVKNPYDESVAEWSTTQYHAGNHSVKLYKAGVGGDCSTHLEIIPPAGITMTAWTAAVATNSFWHKLGVVNANWIQMEFRFEDPNSPAWAEITAVPQQGVLGTDIWLQETLANNTPCGYGGHTEIDTPFFVWGPLTDANLVQTAIDALDGGACTPGDWVLTRVRLELWEAAPERTCHIDTVQIMGVTYTVEPGGTAPGMTLDSGFTELGYTEDGVTVEYNQESSDIEVEEETFPVERPITKERLSIKLNMAEASLYNMDVAMGGAVLSGSKITFGGGVQKEVAVRIEGTNPAGYTRSIFIPLATSVGGVAMPFRKGAKTVMPVEFQALKSPDSDFTVLVTDNAA